MIKSIVGPPEPVIASPAPQAIQSEPAVKVQARVQNVPASAPETRPVEASATEAKSQPKPVEAKVAQASNPVENINLRFRIDQKTQDVTVFMLNQATREVIRTIPPNELSKLKPGDLVNLFA